MRVKNPLEWGLDGESDIDRKRHVVFSNLVYLIVASILLLNTVLFVFSQPVANPVTRFIPAILIVVSLTSYFMNIKGWHLLSRIFFITNWFAFVNIIPIMVIGPSTITYFTAILYVIIFTPAIHLFFSYQHERGYLIFFLAFSFLLTFFFIDFLLAFDRSLNPQVPLLKSAFALKIFYMTLWVFLNVLMVYILRINRRFYREIQNQKEIIESQQSQLKANNERLAVGNRELTVANEKLIVLNEQVNTMNHELEGRVMDRTKELVERNEKLTEYAFMNAHLLRSPVSRIKGLINLFELTKEPGEKEKIYGLLSETAEELDSVIHIISDRLNKA